MGKECLIIASIFLLAGCTGVFEGKDCGNDFYCFLEQMEQNCSAAKVELKEEGVSASLRILQKTDTEACSIRIRVTNIENTGNIDEETWENIKTFIPLLKMLDMTCNATASTARRLYETKTLLSDQETLSMCEGPLLGIIQNYTESSRFEPGKKIAEKQCSKNNPILCPNKECVEEPEDCGLDSSCKKGMVLCPDGKCVENERECEGYFTCPPEKPVLCPDGTCAQTNSDCPKENEEPKTGACCQPKISYVNESGVFPVDCLDSLTEYKCKILQGNWYEDKDCEEMENVCSPKPQEPETGACCHPKISYVNESGVFPVDCLDDLTEYKCTILQGAWHKGLDCEDLPGETCPSLTQEPPKGACCEPKISYVNESGVFPVDCLNNLTENKCTVLQGKWLEEKSCEELTHADCPAIPEPVLTGACCNPKISYVNESGVFPVQCLNNLTEYKCKILQGVWHEEEKCEDIQDILCSPVSQEPETGACCHPKISYVNESGVFPVDCLDSLTEYKCKILQGTWHKGLDCEDLPEETCPSLTQEPETGACCEPKISYVNESGVFPVDCLDSLTEYKCKLLQGKWNSGKKCDDIQCVEEPKPPATGACCNPKISYVNESGVFPVDCLDSLTEYKCKILQGVWHEEEKCEDIQDVYCEPVGGEEPGDCGADMVRCADGTCVNKIEDCGQKGCPGEKPVLCQDGSCVKDAKECAEVGQICEPGLVMCPDGRCVAKPEYCTDVVCPRTLPVLCEDMTCKASVEDCGQKTVCPRGSVMCPDGTCAKTVDDCPQILKMPILYPDVSQLVPIIK